MVDLVTVALLAASFFFVVLSFALLVRYRQVSEKINVSTDMGRDLWASLEQRLKKQDERILDMMARVEVIQTRSVAAASAQAPVVEPPPFLSASSSPTSRSTTPSHAEKQAVQQQESQGSRQSRVPAEAAPFSLEFDETQLAALKLLSGAPKDTRQLTNSLGKSREHTARVMKELYELGLVQRNAASKPFVYQLTEEGQRRVPKD